MYAGSLTPCIVSNPWITSTQDYAYKSLKASDRCNLAYYLHEPGWRGANPTGEGMQNLDETVCESSLCCTRTYCICKVRVIMEIKVREQREKKKGRNIPREQCGGTLMFHQRERFLFQQNTPFAFLHISRLYSEYLW